MQFHYVMADPKVGEQHILTKYSKCNIYQVTANLLNRQYLKIAIAQLGHELQVCNFTVIADPKVAE